MKSLPASVDLFIHHERPLPVNDETFPMAFPTAQHMRVLYYHRRGTQIDQKPAQALDPGVAGWNSAAP